MAWDLALHCLTPRDYSRDSTAPRDPKSELGQLAVLALVVLLPVLPEAIAAAEIYRQRRRLRVDRLGRELHATAEMPVITMSEMVYETKEES